GASSSYTGTVTVKSGAVLYVDGATALGATSGGTSVETGATLAFLQNVAIPAEPITLDGGTGASFSDLPNAAPTSGSFNGAIYVNSTSSIAGPVTFNSNTSIAVVG